MDTSQYIIRLFVYKKHSIQLNHQMLMNLSIPAPHLLLCYTLSILAKPITDPDWRI